MKLQTKLNALKKGFELKAPKDAVEIIHRAADDLRQSGILESVVKVGDKAPDFSLQDGNGKQIILEALLTKGPVVLSFYRGKWWPYCNLELAALEKTAAEINELGASLVAISPQQEVYNRELIQERKLTFQILSDPGNEVAQSYGLKYKFPDDLKEVYLKFNIDLEKYNGDNSWTLPLPTRLIIDADGIIQYVEANVDHTVRPDPEETVSALKDIVDT